MASSPSKKTDLKTDNQKQPSQNEHNPLFIWSSLVAGAGSGALASIVCAPLDLIRTRLQVWGELTGEANKKSIMKSLKILWQKKTSKDASTDWELRLWICFWPVPWPK